MNNLTFATRTLWGHIVRDVGALGGLPLFVVITVYFAVVDMDVALRLVGSLIAIMGTVYTIKFFYFKPRPTVTADTFDTVMERLESSSFPSLHAARAALLFMAFCTGRGMLTGFALLLVAFVGCTRLILKKHDIVDVLAGFTLGAMAGWLIWQM